MRLFRKKKEKLKPCLICNKMTTGDVCSVEHQEEWIKNNVKEKFKLAENIEEEETKLTENIEEEETKLTKDIKKEIKKYPRKQRKKLRLLLEEYNKEKILRPDEDIDNKEYIKSKEK